MRLGVDGAMTSGPAGGAGCDVRALYATPGVGQRGPGALGRGELPSCVCWRCAALAAVFLAACGLPSRALAASRVSDRAVLVALYKATGGENWKNNANWLSDAPIDEWHGVVTDDDGRVTALSLHWNNLRGWMIPDLGSLSNLEYLSLASNRLTGQIPPELGSLPKLEMLNLPGNQLSGGIPLPPGTSF